MSADTVTSMIGQHKQDWLPVVRRYLLVSAIGNLVWEAAQMPLYTLWRTGTQREVAGAILHCSVGDVLIAAAAIVLALALLGSTDWPTKSRWRVGFCTVLFGVAYTIYSEHLSTVVRSDWTYTEAMPVLPELGTGLAPLMQWMAVPAVALLVACRPGRDVSRHPV
jgi:hypothetical protein